MRRLILSLSIALWALSCGSDGNTVLPLDSVIPALETIAGTSLMQANQVYPANGSVNIPLDADIVLAFTLPVNGATVAANVTVSGSITGAIAYVPTTSGNLVTINPTPTLAATELVTVTVNTGLQSSTAVALDQVYVFTFNAGTSPAASFAPRALAGTNTPTGVGVSLGIGTAQIAFSKAVLNVTPVTCTINNGATVTAVNPVGATNTYRLTLTGLAYNTAYTVSLRCTAPAINDGTYNLVDDDGTPNNLWQWTFTTEVNPTPATNVIDSAWAQTATATSAYIYFTTREYVDVTVGAPDCRVRYGTSSGVYTGDIGPEGNWDAGNVLKLLHRVTLTPLLVGVTYYAQAYIDVDGSTTHTVGDIDAAEISFRIHRAATGAVGTQTNMVTVQNSAGGGYLFWESDQSGTNDIYGQYFNSTGVAQWPNPGGSAVCSFAGAQSQIIAVDDGAGGAIVIYKDAANALYAKRVVDAAGITFTWGGPAGGAGVNLGITVAAGTKYSAALVPGGNFVITYIQTGTNRVKARLYSTLAAALQTYLAPSYDPAPANLGGTLHASSGTYTGSGNGTYTVSVLTANPWGTATVQWTWTPEGGGPGAPTGPLTPTNGPPALAIANGVSITLSGGAGLTAGDNWAIDVGDTMNIDNTATFTRTDTTSGSGVTSDFFIVQSMATNIRAQGINITYGSAAPFATTWAAQDNICNTNLLANFLWANPRVFKVLPSLITNGCYLLADNGANSAGMVRITDGAGGIQWANSFAGFTPDLVIDSTAAGADERAIAVYRRSHGANLHIEGISYTSAGGADIVATALTDNAAAYDCFLPRISLADSSANASAFTATWFDGRIAAGDYAVFSGLYSSAGAVQWRSYVWDTTANGGGNPFALSTFFYNDGGGATLGVIPVWEENTGTVDLYYELVTETGAY